MRRRTELGQTDRPKRSHQGSMSKGNETLDRTQPESFRKTQCARARGLGHKLRAARRERRILRGPIRVRHTLEDGGPAVGVRWGLSKVFSEKGSFFAGVVAKLMALVFFFVSGGC